MNKSKVSRSWASTLKFLGGGVVSAGISTALFMTIVEGPISLGFALIPAILALILLYMALAGSAFAACPSCRASIEGLSTGSNDGVCCASCHNYLEGKAGEIWVTDPNRVADTPLFGTRLVEHFSWPDGCCVCGQPATRRLPESIAVTTAKSSAGNAAATIITGGGLLVTGGGSKFTLEIPHCDAHKDGARLSAPNGASDLRVVFRSYPFLRAFCARNGSQPC